jgi:hypothetical protein
MTNKYSWQDGDVQIIEQQPLAQSDKFGWQAGDVTIIEEGVDKHLAGHHDQDDHAGDDDLRGLAFNVRLPSDDIDTLSEDPLYGRMLDQTPTTQKEWYTMTDAIIPYRRRQNEMLGDDLTHAVDRYSDDKFTPINAYLREINTTPVVGLEARHYVENLDKAFRKAPKLQKAETTWRAVHPLPESPVTPFWLELKAGDVFQDKGYVSTSLRAEAITAFSYSHSTDTPGALFEIHVPKGQRTLIGETFELERILPRNTKFRVLKRGVIDVSKFMHPDRLIGVGGRKLGERLHFVVEVVND